MENTHTDVDEVLHETTAISRLNEDTLLTIFDLLPMRDLARTEEVCELWRDKAERSWKVRTSFNLNDLCIEGASDESAERSLRDALTKPTSQLKSMKLDGPMSDRVTDSLMSELTSNCPELTELIISGMRSVSDVGFMTLSNLKQLQFLEIISAYPTDTGFSTIFNGCPNLKDLRIGKNNMTGSCMEFLSPTIVRITLEYCYEFKDLGLVHITSRCSTLKILIINGCSKITDRAILAVTRSAVNKSLKCLEFSGVFSGDRMVIQAAAEDISNCTSLTSLCMRWTNSLNDSVLRAIAKCCKQLEELCLSQLEFTKSVTDVGLEPFAACCPKLTLLEVMNCSGITDKTVQLFAKSGNFTLFNAMGTGISDKGFSVLMEKFPKLKKLNLHECTQVTTESVKLISTFKTANKGPSECEIILGGSYERGSFIEECQSCSVPYEILHVISGLPVVTDFNDPLVKAGACCIRIKLP